MILIAGASGKLGSEVAPDRLKELRALGALLTGAGVTGRWSSGATCQSRHTSAEHAEKALTAGLGERCSRIGGLGLCPVQDADETRLGA
jgi:hypothetical protein